MSLFIKVIGLVLFLFSVGVSAADSIAIDNISDLAHQGDAAALVKLQQGADKGDAEYEIQLGKYYQDDIVLYKASFDKQAFEWYKKAADQGNSEAQERLGYCYESGRGVKQNNNQALMWYTKSALQANADAANALGKLYHELYNPKQAFIWTNKAADQGNGEAQERLGHMYFDGICGVLHKNKIIAYAIYDATTDSISTDADLAAWHLTKAQTKAAEYLEQRMTKIAYLLRLTNI